MTELIGETTMVKFTYQSVASITLKLWSAHIMLKGTQQRKSVAIIAEILFSMGDGPALLDNASILGCSRPLRGSYGENP